MQKLGTMIIGFYSDQSISNEVIEKRKKLLNSKSQQSKNVVLASNEFLRS